MKQPEDRVKIPIENLPDAFACHRVVLDDQGDLYEVMSNGRPYKKAMNKSEIKTEFENCAGKHFDPALTELFLPILDSNYGPAD